MLDTSSGAIVQWLSPLNLSAIQSGFLPKRAKGNGCSHLKVSGAGGMEHRRLCGSRKPYDWVDDVWSYETLLIVIIEQVPERQPWRKFVHG
jgi:hypothetical protein